MHRRTTIALALTTLFALGGCIGFPGANPTTPVSTPTPVDTTPLVDDGDVEYPHDIVVENSLAEGATLTITVEQTTHTLYRTTHTVPAGADATVAGITRVSLPEDERQLRISATDERGGSATVTVSVSDCLGDVIFFYDAGDLQATYSIC